MKSIISYIKDPLRIGFGIIRRMSPLFKNDQSYLKLLYYLRTHKKLDLIEPTTFSEKLQWLKLHYHKPELSTMVDKYEVKEYLSKIIGEEYVIPTLGVWDRPEDINWEALPDKFVLKTTHGGGSVGVVICRDKNIFDKDKALGNLKKSLKQDIYKTLREWPYKNVKKRIIAEPLLENHNVEAQDLTDYKFFCFDGDPKYCQVISGRDSYMTIDFYDKNWKHQPFHEPKDYPFSTTSIPVPVMHNYMLEIASRLSKGYPFLRVDFYEVNERLYVGELTFFPTSGFGGFDPQEWDYKFGSWIKLPVEIK